MKLPAFRDIWCVLLAFAVTASAAERPNVVFILADDMGFSDLGCYGGEIATPNLDSLAANGLRFTQFYNTSRCWPTRASLLTGYYPQQVGRDALPGVGGGPAGVRPAWARLLPDFLRREGYRNYHSGKWHMDGSSREGGFNRSFSVIEDGNYFSAQGTAIDDVPVEPPADDSGYYMTTAIADHAIDCLEQHASRFSDQPFFSYVAFMAPHFPLHALPEDIARYRDSYLIGWDEVRASRYKRLRELGITDSALSAVERELGPQYDYPDDIKKLGPGEVNRPLPWNELNPEQQRFQATKMAIYAAMIDRMDREIGRIVDQLKKMGAFENTMIFFASDNGANAQITIRSGGHDPAADPGSAASYLCLGPGFSSASNTPFRRHKTWTHEGGISTPLIVHWPEGIAAKGELRHTPSHMIDVVPTILEVTGIEKPARWRGTRIPDAPGTSLAPAFQSDLTLEREPLWWLHEGNRAIRVDDWKLVASKNDPWELYDLRTDRAEQKNLAAEMPEKVAEMEGKWTQKLLEMRRLAKREEAGK